jgi:leucyl aminopeptidase
MQFVTEKQAEDIPDFKGKKNEVTLRYERDICHIYCGLGTMQEEGAVCAYRSAAAAGARKAVALERDGVALAFQPEADTEAAIHGAALEGVLTGSYRFVRYKSETGVALKKIELVHTTLRPAQIRRIRAICDGVAYTRDLVNENAEDVYPDRLAREARAIAQKGGMRCEILTEKQIREKKLGLLYAVGKGSHTPPRLAIVSYTGNPRSKETLALVGKGITFDSGGQNLKPSGHIETMKEDMGGAATVLGVMKAIAAIKPKINCVFVLPAAHNAVGSRTYFPGDVYTSYSGKTVEIKNTDAEGRLILADAFSYCQKHYKPTRIIDLATLTGGIVYALGTTVAGVFTNTDAVYASLYKSGMYTNERVWRFPIYREHREAMKSDIADLANTSKLKKGEAGSITAAAFLQEFINDGVQWAHMDIAGVAYREGEPHDEMPNMATGFGVRLLSHMLIAAD